VRATAKDAAKATAPKKGTPAAEPPKDAKGEIRVDKQPATKKSPQ
jgi:hypothetical protein